ncbi:HTTM domain-containing protein [Flavobacterium sp. NRK F10]|uniref:HTTM domain-containing protein n=2 Tax=Flavobacterium TaxID=237 RepID=UPI002090CD8E|nr:HTTM domain-containing protein [Flavobacterium sp. NRK F10]MCO6174569.1 HTTM domain-containing protein [Flavobacterium sp. NRK F10]
MFKTTFFKSVDIAPLIVFRIIFGFLVAMESFGAILTGWVKKVFIEPEFTFPFIGFEWLQPLPENGMYLYFAIMGILGIFIITGFYYRISIAFYTLLWAGVYFMQKTSYNNHYYLLLLISFVMIFLPANQEKSLDVKLNRTIRKQTMPNWIRMFFIIMIGIVYTYAALAKFYPDWLDGTFTKNLLLTAPLFNCISKDSFIYDLFNQKWFYLLIAYAGIFYDLLIVPLLLFKRTRTIALISSLIFHLFNSITLQIGIFPYFALSFALFFYPPEKIRRLFLRDKEYITSQEHYNYQNRNVFYFLFIPFLTIQLLLPLRHHLIEGDVLWTEEGHRLSWRMMLRKRSGYISFRIVDRKTDQSHIYNHYDKLSSKQHTQIATKPDFIWQFCQKIKSEYADRDISIYVNCKNAINEKKHLIFIDPEYDMAKAEWNYFTHNEWILLHEPDKVFLKE